MIQSGIYEIRNIINGKSYYGSAVNIKSRWASHVSDLKRKKHINKHLQCSVNKHGLNNFKFNIILLTNDNLKLLEYEQIYLDAFWDKGKNCYNVCPVAGSTLGRNHSNATKAKIKEKRKLQIMTDEHRKNISKGMKNRTFSDETKKLLSASQVGNEKGAKEHNIKNIVTNEIIKIINLKKWCLTHNVSNEKLRKGKMDKNFIVLR